MTPVEEESGHPVHNSYLHTQQIFYSIPRTGDSNEIHDRLPACLALNWLSSGQTGLVARVFNPSAEIC